MKKVRVAFGNDHRGYVRRPDIIAQLISVFEDLELELDFLDLGHHDPEESCDYPHIAQNVAEAVQNNEVDFAILMCGTGIGMSIAANRYAGIRAALCRSPEDASLTREHNDANVLCLGASTDTETICEILKNFFSAEFDGGTPDKPSRHARRLQQIDTDWTKLGRQAWA